MARYTAAEIQQIWQHVYGGGTRGAAGDVHGERIDAGRNANGDECWFVVAGDKLWAMCKPESWDYPMTSAWVPCPPAEKIANLRPA